MITIWAAQEPSAIYLRMLTQGFLLVFIIEMGVRTLPPGCVRVGGLMLLK